jgi:hypothetical protein
MEHCKGGDLFKMLMMKGGTLDEHWVCTEVSKPHHPQKRLVGMSVGRNV